MAARHQKDIVTGSIDDKRHVRVRVGAAICAQTPFVDEGGMNLGPMQGNFGKRCGRAAKK